MYDNQGATERIIAKFISTNLVYMEMRRAMEKTL